MKTFDDLFLAHPRAAGETYFQHMRFAFGFSAILFKAASAAFIHGLLPEAFETTASTTVLDLSDQLRARRAALAAGKLQMAKSVSQA